MELFKRIMAFVVIAAVGLALAACSRDITRVEQVAAGPQACFECHTDTSTFLVAAVQQWEHSKHASGETTYETGTSCAGCHTSEGFLARVAGTAVTSPENPTAIGCFTCHAPHTNGDFRLRWTAVATLESGVSFDLKAGNTCVACHHARRDVTTYIKPAPATTTLSTRFGPHHGPQGDLLIGSNGYEYDGYTYEQTNHRSATTDGCLDCHMRVATGIVTGGHSFNMEWDEGAEPILNTGACAKCHGALDDFDYGSTQTDVDGLVADLQARLVTAGLLSASGTPLEVATSADSAGAVWNLVLVKEDRSHGIHNPQYVRGLLQSSIEYISGSRPQNGTVARVQQAMRGARNRQ